ncbi:class I SAM-dependent methyltransferase [Siminovitchia fortis]|uniref:Class I SAM-dependent methyltransferase n=1 Tax=Siminovitchia fortis TaxID=254758 RepID=A0A443IK99_9BACI|nr:class I SAM-dependent methyltransferase [Siminovitchia fortis]RWR05145.1 class I SAM-dependent methyltransferase [Siminovitchia fortis]WHY81807.1 class I SAM-dependent methyltransferase [Siminovitchia fortis]
MEREKLIRIFDRQAARYASNKDPSSLRRWRRQLLSHAEGEVLELAVGAGANFPYYPAEVKVTAADFSEEMLAEARKKASACNIQAELICTDIEKMEFSSHSFDTIVSTLSFCCYENPLDMLKKIQRWCRPDGRILLLEHGISSNFFVSSTQRALNPLLYKMIGCHQTRDILKLGRDSGLNVHRSESHWLNMFHIIWASPGTEEIF